MADFAGGVATAVLSEITKYLVAPIGRQLGYLFCYNANIGKMKNQIQKLDEEMNRLQQQINTAENNSEVIKDDVLRWNKDAIERKEEVDKIKILEKEVGNGCWNEWCLNLKSRYRLSRKATKETRDLMDLVTRSSFTSISHPRPAPGIVSPSPQGTSHGSYMVIETRRSILREVIEALKDDAIHMIGIWGMAGVGKTTLVKEVLDNAKDEHLFDEVAMAVVSQVPDIKGIQDSISVYLGMELKGGDIFARALQLRVRLAQVGKRKLIVLDDVWRRLDLEEVGIPCGDDFKGCKIMLTSRVVEVCNQMSTDKNFLLEVLHMEEARLLFKRKVDYSSFHCDWRSTAEAIVDECGGLPLAITTIATALVKKEEATWANVLRTLQNAIPEGPNAKVFDALRVSYDFLETEEIKKFFLLCCLFAEDASIPIEELLRYGVGLGLFEKTNDMHEARNQAKAQAETLQNSNLLLPSYYEGHVCMHDLMRDFAISIVTASGRHVKRWPWPMENSRSDSNYTLISRQLDGSNELPNRLRCPNLELLRVVNKDMYRVKSRVLLPEGFCEGMDNLQVMTLGGMIVQSLPQSLKGLISLRTLSLGFCKLKGDLSIIGNLQSLEILSFARSDIEELPREIGKLTRLRLLDLTDCEQLRTIAAGVLSSLTCLEELYMRGIAFKWEEEVSASSHKDESRASFNDLKKLAKLIALEINIPYEVLPTGSLFDNLKKFKISIAGGKPFGYLSGVGNALVLRANKSVLVEGLIDRLCSKAVYLCLEVKDLKSLPEELEREGFSKLRILELVSCGGLVSIGNSMGTQDTANVFPDLERLHLKNLGDLEVMCRGQLSKQSVSLPSSSTNQLVSFGKLRNLDLRCCSKLKSIFTLSIARNLINLELLEIVECQMMEEIFSEERGDPDENAVVGKIAFPRLKCLELRNLPNLVAFSKALVEVELPQLEKMHLEGLTKVTTLYPGRETLASENDQHCLFKHKVILDNVAAATEIQPAQDPNDSFSKLRSMEVRNCERLLNVFPSNTIQQLRNLQDLQVRDCCSVELVFDLEGSNSEEGREVEVLPRLRKVFLTNLPKLKHIVKGGLNLSRGFQNLSSLNIDGCDCLETIVSGSIARGLVMLQSLNIKKCQMVEAIFSNGSGEVLKIELPKLQELTLESLPNLVGFCDSVDEVELPKLEELSLVRVPKFGGVYLDTEISSSEHHHASPERPSFKSMVTLSNLMKRVQNLQSLTVSECHSVEMVFNLQELNFDGRFQNLRKLHFSRCDSLRQLFTLSMAKILVKLEGIQISNCKLLEAIVAKEEGGEEDEEGILFPQLTWLYLSGLPKLLTLAPKSYSFNWSSITELTMVDCGRVAEALTNEFSEDDRGPKVTLSNLMKRVQNLQSLRVSECHSVEMVFNLQELNFDGGFQNLRELYFSRCDSLRQLFTLSMAKILVKLKEIEIRDCKLFEAIVAKEEGGEEDEEGILFPQLTWLYLSGLPKLLTLAPKSYSFNWSSITELTMVDCGRVAEALTNEFSEDDIGPKEVDKCERSETRTALKSEVIQQLQNLEYLTLGKLNSIEVVFYLQGPPSIIRGFQNMISLTLNECDCLKHLFTSSAAKILVELEYLNIGDCKLLEAIVAEEEEEGGEEEEGILFPKLESLKLKGLPNLLTIMPHNFNCSSLRFLSVEDCGKGAEALLNDKLHEGDQQVASCSTEKLQVSKMNNTLFTTNMIPRLHNLEGVYIEKCSSVEVVFDLQGLDVNEGCEVLAPALKRIALIGLPKLTNIWKRGLHNIQAFQNMESLKVKGCDNLRYLFTPSTAKNLVQLQNLKIIECKVLEAIVEKEEEEDDEEYYATTPTIILFPQLTTLYLVGLPNLMTITPKAYRVDWSYTEYFVVDRCGEGAATLTPIILNRQRVALATLTESDRTTKRTWPELVGLSVEEANIKIKEDVFWADIVVVSEQALVNMSSTTVDVLIVFDSSGKVVRPPRYS